MPQVIPAVASLAIGLGVPSKFAYAALRLIWDTRLDKLRAQRKEAIALLRDAPSVWERVRLMPWLLIAFFVARGIGRVPLRELRRGLDGRVGDGNCLAPWLTDGEIAIFDRTIEPRDGDIVVTETRCRIRAGLGTPSRELVFGGAKQLRIVNGTHWLTCADGSYLRSPDHNVVGVVVAVARRPWRKAPPMAEINFPIRPIAA